MAGQHVRRGIGDPRIEAVDHCLVAVVDLALALERAQSFDDVQPDADRQETVRHRQPIGQTWRTHWTPLVERP